MDEFVRKAAALGFPAVVLLVVMATSGLTGAAAITSALAFLGPGGMLGGIFFLGIIGLASDMLAKYGLEALLVAIYEERIRQGTPRSTICYEIRHLPISGDLKRLLREKVRCSS